MCIKQKSVVFKKKYANMIKISSQHVHLLSLQKNNTKKIANSKTKVSRSDFFNNERALEASKCEVMS